MNPHIEFLPKFHGAIKSGVKIHTIRKTLPKGLKIGQMLDLKCSETGEIFASKFFISKQRIEIDPETKTINIRKGKQCLVLSPTARLALILNSGFRQRADFWEFFDKPFKGYIIHWTHGKYFAKPSKTSKKS